jgi:hypothetical protein
MSEMIIGGRGCLGIHSGVTWLGLRVIMRLNNESLKIEKFKWI